MPLSGEELPRQFTYPFCYEPHPLTQLAAGCVQQHLARYDECPESLKRGKMLGVLVVEDEDGETGYLAAYSGEVAGLETDDYFVPPIYDLSQPGGEFKRGEVEITAINQRIAALEADSHLNELKQRLEDIDADFALQEANYREKMAADKARRAALRASVELRADEQEALIRESQFEKAEMKRMRKAHAAMREPLQREISVMGEEIGRLKQERKQRSEALQRRIFELFVLRNGRGEQKNLLQIFSEHNAANGESGFNLPPAGAGECAAPRLLQYAYAHNLKPISMGEFWWGDSPEAEIRRQGEFYPSCHHKCFPILTYMLQGIDVEPNPLAAECDVTLSVVWEDAWLKVVNKPAGLASVDGKAHSDSVEARERRTQPDAVVTHRLDQATSGLLIVAKDKETGAAMQRAFERGDVKKTYLALLRGRVESDKGEINLPLNANYADRPRQIVDKIHGKEAVTTFRVVGRFDNFTLVEFHPHQGRTHQLRVHSASVSGLGAPIAGDTLYGGGSAQIPDEIARKLSRECLFTPRKTGGIWLQAQQVEFVHPVTGESIQISVRRGENCEQDDEREGGAIG